MRPLITGGILWRTAFAYPEKFAWARFSSLWPKLGFGPMMGWLQELQPSGAPSVEDII